MRIKTRETIPARGGGLEVNARRGIVSRWRVRMRTSGSFVQTGRAKESWTDGESIGDVCVGASESAIAPSYISNPGYARSADKDEKRRKRPNDRRVSRFLFSWLDAPVFV